MWLGAMKNDMTPNCVYKSFLKLQRRKSLKYKVSIHENFARDFISERAASPVSDDLEELDDSC